MGRFVVAGFFATVLTSCGTGAFACADDSECAMAAGGRCEPSGFCSFPDDDCESGYRYGDHAGDGLATLCVDPIPNATTSESTGTTTSASGEGSGGSTAATTIALDDSSGGPPCADWWDCTWLYRRALTLAPDAVTETIDGLVVPIGIPDVSDTTRFGPTGHDVRVVTADGTVLPFDVEDWDPEGSGMIWARLPAVHPDTSIAAHLYYGKPDASSGSDASATWADYAAVWHLTDLIDSTGQGQEPADEGSTPADGRFGGGRRFDAPDQRLRVAPSPALADLPVDGMTLLAITMPLSTGVDSGGRIFDNADATSATRGVTIMPSLQTMSIEVNRGAATTEAAWHGVEPLPFGRWTHLVVTLDDVDGAFAFIDGVPVTWSMEVAAVGMLQSDARGDIGIGGAPYDATHTFDGIIDELRVIRGVRSEAWVSAQYAVTLGGALTLGDEETAPQ